MGQRRGLARGAGPQLAGLFTSALEQLENGAYVLGQWVGWAIGALAFEAVLAFATAGVGNAAAALSKVAWLGKGAKWGSKALDVLAQSLRLLTKAQGMIDEAFGVLLAGLGKLPLIRHLAPPLQRLWDDIARWFDELGGTLRRTAGEVVEEAGEEAGEKGLDGSGAQVSGRAHGARDESESTDN